MIVSRGTPSSRANGGGLTLMCRAGADGGRGSRSAGGQVRRRREESSCHWRRIRSGRDRIKKERGGCLQHVSPQLVPRVPFGEDAVRKALGAVPAAGLLDHPRRGAEGGARPAIGAARWPRPAAAPRVVIRTERVEVPVVEERVVTRTVYRDRPAAKWQPVAELRPRIIRGADDQK